MEDNEKTNDNSEEINANVEPTIADTDATADEKKQLDANITNETTNDSTTPAPTNQAEQLPTTNEETQCPAQAMDKTIEKSVEESDDVDQQQLQVPTSSTESTGQCPDDRIDETKLNCDSQIIGTSDSTIPATIATNSESVVLPTNTNEANIDDNDEDNANDSMASSSRLVERESDCRTETKLDNKLDKSEIINELTTASIANCDSSEILDDSSMNLIHSNGSNNSNSNNVSDSRGNDNVDVETNEMQLSCNVNAIENGAKDMVNESVGQTADGTSNEPENCPTLSTTTTTSSPMACAIDPSSPIDSTEDVKHSNDSKPHEEPTSSVTESEKTHTERDKTPSVHSNISDKGGGTDNRNSDSPPQNQQLSPAPANNIVLNNPVDSINSLIDTNVQKSDEPVVVHENKSEESSTMEICSSSRTEENKIGCDPKHSSIVENQIAYGGSVIRPPTNLIVPNVKENSDPEDEFQSSSSNQCTNADRIVRSESSPHIELPKPLPVSTSTKTIESKEKSSYNLMLDLTQPHSLSSRQNSLYVSNPDFTRPKPSTEDLSSLRMKPPDFSKLTHAYSTNNLKISNPNFNEIEAAPPLKKHQPPVNPANFAEISKRLNYISDLQLKTTTTPSTHTNSFDRPIDSSRSLSNLYVKAPDFSGQKKKSYDTVDEPTAHVIHKNPYPIQTDSKVVTPMVATAPSLPSSDPSIIYRSYPQISQDVTMSIVPNHSVPFPQPPPQQLQPQQNHHHHQQPLSQKQNMVEPQQSIDQRYKQNYPTEMVHKGHPGLYRSPIPTAPHHLYENRIPDSSHSSKPMNTSYNKHKTEQVSNSVHPYQRESTRAAVIQTGKPVSEPDATFSQKAQSIYAQRSEIQYYDKPVAKPIVASQQGHGPPLDYMQQHVFNNSRYPPEFNDRIPPTKSSYERPGYCEPMPGLYQEQYKQPQPSLKHNSSTNNTQMAAPSNRPLHSPVMNSKPIDIPSSGHMNPPQYWPSHSPRITQSPISLSSSPLSGRVTQSPAGASPSPQHHVMPSALPAQSPTYRYASPHQPQTPSPYNNIPTTTASSPIQFKDNVNPAMYQKPSKSKSSKSSSKGSVSQPGSTPNYYYLPPKSTHYPGHQYSMKVEQSAPYPPHQYSTKTDNNIRDDARTKPTKSKMFPDYVDLTKPSKTSDPSHMPNLVGQENSRYDHRYVNERNESQQNHRTETTSTKHAPESSMTSRTMLDKHNVYNSQQKTIMDPYAYRKASEADLNYEIIKKTLNKDISIRRSDADLSCSIFDTPKSNQSKNVPYPTPNEQYYGRGTSYPPNFNYHPQSTPEATSRRDGKGVVDANRYNSGPAQPVTAKSYDVAEQAQSTRGKTYPVDRPPNDLKKHDLSVTVSRISAAIAQPVERARLQHSETTIPIPHQQSTSRHQTTSQPAKNHLTQPSQQAVPQKPSSTSVKSVLAPVKRESPLDLSVKTVKTKADSTGDDYAMPSSSRDYNAPLSLKVDFSPNFQKHARSVDKTGTSNHMPTGRYENQMANPQYPSPALVHRPPTQHPLNQNVPQRNPEKLLADARYHHTNPHQNAHQSQGPSTYAQSQAPMTAPSTQIRSHQMPNESFKHQSKPLVLSPTVPTVFGRKPEELKNLPINPDLHDYKLPSNTATMGPSYENDHRSKNQTTKSNYHSKVPEHLSTSHHKPQEIPVKFSDFKTKTIQIPSIPLPVESSKDRPPYPYATGERPTYVAQYQEQRPMHIPSQSRLVEQLPPGHYDPYYSRKRLATEPPSHHDQYTKAKQMRRDEPPTNQHGHYYNNVDKRYPPSTTATEAKGHDRYEMPAEKMNYHPKFMGVNYQREMPPVDVEQRENIQHPAGVVRENIPPNYGSKQHPSYQHYPEPMYNQSENKPVAQPPTIVSYPTEQHQKHLAYQKSKKEAYKQLPSPPNQHNYYPRDGKLHPYENNYSSESYQSYKPPEVKPFYNEPGAYAPNTQYPKQDANSSPQVYQQSWPPNQPILQPDSSKQPYYPTTEIRSYRDFNPSTHPPQTDVAARPNHRSNPTDPSSSSSSSSRHSTTLKGADQTVISKLRNNLEMKEIEKQKLLRSQSSTETVDDDNQRSDIASLIAARIRTKGELKGFTPMPAVPEPTSDTSNRCDEEMKKDLPAVTNPIHDLDTDVDNGSAFDLLDWGSACNDFVEQLQGSSNKKRGRRRRGKSSLIDTEFETVGQEVPLQSLPGVDYKCDIDESLVNIVKAENKTHHREESVSHSGNNQDEDSSSDEDKPLLFLRQKSLNELGKLKTTTQDDDAVKESSTFSESTKQSTEKRTIVLGKLSEKIAKNKKGQQREKRENEKRISIASSSESDDDVPSSKLNKRPKKTVRKPRTRSSVGYKNTSDDETTETGSKNSKRKNDHTKRKKSSKSSSDSELLKQRKKNSKIDSDETDDDEDVVKMVTTIKQEVISDDDESDCKMEMLKTPVKKEPGVVSVKVEETMTRSKRKQELERQKANSKILRNDKMVKNVSIVDLKKGTEKNVSPKSKSKTKDDAKRKSDDTETGGESSKNDSAKKKGFRIASIQSISSDSEEAEVEVSPRRRTRSAKSMDQRTPEKAKNVAEKVVEKKWSRNTPQKKNAKEPPLTKQSTEQYPPGWENEVYEFKRSLKIPASLITIKRPSWYRKSISLPDLDPHSSDTSETFSEKKQLFLKPFSELSDRRPSKKDGTKQNRSVTNSTSTNVTKIVVEASEKRPDDLRSKSIIPLTESQGSYARNECR